MNIRHICAVHMLRSPCSNRLSGSNGNLRARARAEVTSVAETSIQQHAETTRDQVDASTTKLVGFEVFREVRAVPLCMLDSAPVSMGNRTREGPSAPPYGVVCHAFLLSAALSVLYKGSGGSS